MGYKTDKEGYAKEQNSYGNEDKQNGFMEDTPKVPGVG